MSAQGPLADVRVLDLSRGGAARACGRLLAQLGATMSRHLPLQSPLRARHEVACHEIVLSDLRPLEAASLGLGLPALQTFMPPGGVAVSATPFGLDGPYAECSVVQSAWPDIESDVAVALAGAHAAVAALAALLAARHQQRNMAVEVATLEVVAACMGEHVPRWICPRPPAPVASDWLADPRVVVLPCADGFIGVAAPTLVDRQHLAALTGIEAVAAPASNLPEVLGPWVRTRSRAELFHSAQLWRLPLAPVLQPAEVIDDEQSAARGFWTRDSAGHYVAGSPFRFSSPESAGTVARRGARAASVGATRWVALPGSQSRKRQPAAISHQPRPGSLPLSDLMVLDLGMVWAGPHCGRLLAGLGARVIKVEGPTRPDGTRRVAGAGCSGAFSDLNRGKESLVLDLAHTDGRALFLQLAARADVILENFSPRVMPNFDLDYSVLSAANPGLVMLSMPAFGSDGPWANHVAFGSGLELAAGLANWTPNGYPQSALVPYTDYLAGAYGAAGVLAALLARDQSGHGSHVEVAQREVACQLTRTEPGTRHQPLAWLEQSEALARDPNLAARGLFALQRSGPCACHHYARLPWRLRGLPERHERSAPGFGADSRRILRREARLETDDMERLIGAGVVGAPMRRRGRSDR